LPSFSISPDEFWILVVSLVITTLSGLYYSAESAGSRALLRSYESAYGNCGLLLRCLDSVSNLLSIRQRNRYGGDSAAIQILNSMSAAARQLAGIVERLSEYAIRRSMRAIFARTRQTAQAIGSHFGMEVVVRPGLREIQFGQWEVFPGAR